MSIVGGTIGGLTLSDGAYQRAFCGDALNDPLLGGHITLDVEWHARGWRRLLLRVGNWLDWAGTAHRPLDTRYHLEDVQLTGMRFDNGMRDAEVTFVARDGHTGSIAVPR